MVSLTHHIGLLALLHEEKELTETNLKLVEAYQKKWDMDVFEAILETHLLSEAKLADVLAIHFKANRLYIIDENEIPPEIFEKIDFFSARSYGTFPLGFTAQGSIKVALFDPTRRETLEFLDRNFETYELFICERRTVLEAINRLYPLSSQLPNLLKSEVTQDE